MSPSQLVSVVVTTYNRSDALLAVLHGLALQTDAHFEVIVADDGSTPGHQEQLLKSGVASQLALTHVWHPDVGFTASKVRNRGVAACQGDYIVFLDGDCVPEVDFITNHKRLAQPGCFVNGSRVLLSRRFTERSLASGELIAGRSAFFWLKHIASGDANRPLGLLRLPDWSGRVQKAFSWKGIRSCNMGVWRADFERVDGFDESFVGWGHEDADFVLRLHHAGLARKNGFCATEVFHLWHAEAARTTESRNAQTVRDRALTTETLAASGYSQVRPHDDVVVTRLG